MTMEEAKREIEKLGWFVIARTSWHDLGYKFDATNYLELAEGEYKRTEDEAMVSCLEAVRRRTRGF